jgi:hypothetical protein
MKKRALGFVVLLMVCVLGLGLALAEEQPAVKLGEGAVTFSVYVVADQDNTDEAELFEIATDEKSLLDALMKVEFIEGEEVSWGFNVTMVNGITADYETDGAYWSIYFYNAELEELERLETAIGETPLETGSLFAFIKEQ